MKGSICPLFILLICLSLASAVYGQDYKKMRRKIVEEQQNTRQEINTLNDQISKYEKRLKQANKKYQALYSKYQDLEHLIALRDDKIKKLQKEQSQIEAEINITEKSIRDNRKKLKELVAHYKKTMRYLYMQGRSSQMALILSSASVNQMLVRTYYLKKFSAYRKNQADQIRQSQKELAQTKKQQENARGKNNNVLSEIQDEKKQLAEKKKQQQKNVTALRQNKNELQSRLEEVQQQKKKFNNTLNELIKQEDKIRKAQEARLRQLELRRKQKLAEAKKIKDANKRAAEVAKYDTPIKGAELVDYKKIESGFAKDKGHLPWPVKSRAISEHFGRRRHPVYGTVTPSLGIEIVTDSQASVHSVFKGKVIDVLPITGYGDVVFVKHGRFITAYGNLSKIMVRKNQILGQGDLVGLSGDENSTNGESLFFLIRDGKKNVDPEDWLQG